MKNKNIQQIFILLLLFICNTFIYGQVTESESVKAYRSLLNNFTTANYDTAKSYESTKKYEEHFPEMKNLHDKTVECSKLKTEADSLSNQDSIKAYEIYLKIYELNPSDSTAKSYYNKYIKLKQDSINGLKREIVNKEKNRKQQTDSINQRNDSIICHLNQQLKSNDSIICHLNQQLQDTSKLLNDTRYINSELTDRLDSVRNEQKTTKWEKKRLNDFRNFIKAEYDYYNMEKKANSSLAEAAYNSFNENKIDSALSALNDTIINNAEKKINSEAHAYLRILKAQLLEFVFDFEKSEANYKKADSISHSFECRIPLITFYYRQKRDKDANERYGEWKKLIKGEEGKLYQGQLKILKNLNKFNKKFLNPFEAKNTSIPDSAKMEAYFISGNLLLKEKSLSKAEKYLRKAKEIEEKLQMDSIYKAKLYYALGKAISEDPKKIPDKKDFYEGALRFFGKDSLKYMPERAEVCDSIGKLLLSDNYKKAKKKENENDNYYEVAEDYFRKSLKIYEQLAGSEPQTYNRYECDYVANLYNKLGVAQSKNSKWAEADISFKESLTHYRYLFANYQAHKEEAKVIINRAINYYAQNKKDADKKKIENWVCSAIIILSECNIAYSGEYVKMGIGVVEEYLHKTLYEDDYGEKQINFNSYERKTDKIKPELIYD
ncbi:hypothetical protein AGMMS50239_39700 [Bacteroidia bacterium]|nr:hypothetical protein AGMMS50239_39700 [Bacteroidia bacterium]